MQHGTFKNICYRLNYYRSNNISTKNTICIHLDKKAYYGLYEALETISKCCDNIILAKKREDVIYAHFSRLQVENLQSAACQYITHFQADFNCIDELLNQKRKWKYFINLCGHDFPTKTNSQIAAVLKTLYPKNSIESVPFIPHDSRYIRYLSIIIATGY